MWLLRSSRTSRRSCPERGKGCPNRSRVAAGAGCQTGRSRIVSICVIISSSMVCARLRNSLQSAGSRSRLTQPSDASGALAGKGSAMASRSLGERGRDIAYSGAQCKSCLEHLSRSERRANGRTAADAAASTTTPPRACPPVNFRIRWPAIDLLSRSHLIKRSWADR